MGQMTHYRSCQSFLLLNLNHLFPMHSLYLYGWFIFSQFSVTWCFFCIVGHFQWFSKSSLTYSTNTVIIFECICMLDKSIKQWLFSPLRLVTSSRLQFMQGPGGLASCTELSKLFKCTSTSLFTGTNFS
jgi:hypothetical protein